jgi:hypothetical protein
MHRLKDFEKIYHTIEVPDHLELLIEQTTRREKMKSKVNIVKKLALSAAALMVIFTGMVNINPSFASNLSKLPLIGSMVKVVAFRFDVIENDNVHANIETPVIEGLNNPQLEKQLNEKYMSTSKELYEDFMKDMGEIIEMDGHLGVDSGYVVYTDTNQVLSMGRYTVNTVGSSSTSFEYDTIDKENGLLLSLPGLFKNDDYIQVISDYLIETMKKEMNEDESLVYWVKEDAIDPFTMIDPNQSFYITPESKLVISFDKYELAPGYMGVVTFQIPTDLLKDLLVNNHYIK